MKILISEELCAGHGRCYSLAPDLIGADEEGFASPRGVAIEVPTDQANAAAEAVSNCPESAISVIAE